MLKVSVNVTGMACQMCEKKVNEAIEKNFSVKRVSSDHNKNLTEIICENAPDAEKLKEIIKECGFEAGEIKVRKKFL